MKIFIKGLPLQVGESELREVFGDFGKVNSLRIIKDRETGKSRGFGFVEMPNELEAKDAIKSMNGGDYYGHKIFVTEAKEDGAPQGGGGGGRGNGGGGFNRGGGSYGNNRGSHSR
ncbi:RNA recognition motif domain-containing protein [Desertivirga arenae]|uniref:RNA recognition motif domain-containing protein n=1 Tax=Desertivirga arenae TaxID=2810309 RepID=UPI001A97D24F|nr:RNA-binding protein [Pedobacter sp. SYSU D00823]